MASLEKTPTYMLSQYVHDLNYNDIPVPVVEYAKLLVLDYLASAMAGYKVNQKFNKIAQEVIGGMGGKPESTVFFGGGHLPVAHAAFLNAVYGHGADLDDGHRTAQGHAGVTVIPAVLALAELKRASGKDIITAIVAGYDIYVRLSNAIMPSHFFRGFHGTGTVGAVAAGAAAAKILGLSEDGTRRSISLAAVQASGLFEVTESGQMAKPINPGNAVRTGILSALFAQAGSDAPLEPLEGKKGFLRAFADQVNLEPMLNDLGKKFMITTCYIKIYPACRHIHAPVDIAIALRKKGLPPPEQIEKIKIYIYPAAIFNAGQISEPDDEDGAKFSITYATATALLTGNFTLDDLEATRSMSDEVRACIRKMELVSTPELENRETNIRGARIEVIQKDGSVLTSSVDLPKGDPEVPLEVDDMRKKLRFCGKGIYSEQIQQRIYEKVMKLDQLNDLESLIKMLD